MQRSGIQSDVSLDDRHLGLFRTMRANGVLICDFKYIRERWESWVTKEKKVLGYQYKKLSDC